MFVKYIQAETGTRVQIKGLGSGFIENDTGREADEPMHVYIRSVSTSDRPARDERNEKSKDSARLASPRSSVPRLDTHIPHFPIPSITADRTSVNSSLRKNSQKTS